MDTKVSQEGGSSDSEVEYREQLDDVIVGKAGESVRAGVPTIIAYITRSKLVFLCI